ncbi:hypothetical protein Q8F55_000364 [Vanrija albida]|uniref:F-box domain-containing protein n=1 Tax=Vanrija albida TaxID=181172 RepID=A0ABR3QD79_9TREE
MPTLLDLPREVIRAIAVHIYDPLELTQQDRLTWGIFSTVDMHEERQDALFSLIALGDTCRKVRREVRVILFRCIRIPTVWHAYEAAKYDWAPFVRSIIIDLTMFDLDEVPRNERRPRSCWHESALLSRMINALPCLQHISFFADASDDSTLSLLFASIIDHPSRHARPQPDDEAYERQPIATRLKSFGWRQRAAPPSEFRTFSQTSTFVSTMHVLRHAHNLSFLVLDADMDEMGSSDILTAVRELAKREAPLGQEPAKVSLMLCGPIAGWEDGFLDQLVDTFRDIRELFLDRPLKKLIRAVNDENEFINVLAPLQALPYLQLVQVGSYTFSLETQQDIALRLAYMCPSLVVIGLLGSEGDTTWWGAWRGAGDAVYIRPMGDGHLFLLEDCARASRRPSLAGIEELISKSRRASFASEGGIVRSRRSSVGTDEGSRSRRSSFGSMVTDDDPVRVKRSFLASIDDKLRPLSAIDPGKSSPRPSPRRTPISPHHV